MGGLTRRGAMAGLVLAGAARAEDWSKARIYRFAGGGHSEGDGGLATETKLSGPAGVAVDPQGNVFIAELKRSLIRRVGRSGIITTVAGNGAAGFSGDGGPARQAMLHRPEGVSADGFGNIYIADSGNDRIRRVDANGITETIAGGGSEDPRRFEGPARLARLNHPAGVMVDDTGTVFFNDYGNDVVCAVTPDGQLRRVAGSQSYGYAGDGGPAREAKLNDIYGIGLDPHGNLYICDSLNFAIRKVGKDGRITTLIGDGQPGDDATRLCGTPHPKGIIGSKVPHGVDADGDGNVFIADTAAHRLRLLAKGSKRLITIAGNGEPGTLVSDGAAALSAAIELHGVRCLPNGGLVFPDYLHDLVYRLDTADSMLSAGWQ